MSAAFAQVEEELARQLAESDAGAAFSAVVDGEPVLDLWGGTADPEAGIPWRSDTLCLVFSGAKGLLAVCVLLLLERCGVELDAPFTRYCPRFGAQRGLLVRHVVGHEAGLPGLRAAPPLAELLDARRAAQLLAEQEPYWPPGERLAYHAYTLGWLCGELVRAVDGRPIGRFFADEIAGPLGLELWLGLPAELESKVARLVPAADYGVTFVGDEPDPLLDEVYCGLRSAFPWNDPALHAAELPAANAIGTARSLARLYGCLARGGEIDGVRVLRESTVRLGRAELSRGVCAITRRRYAFGCAFELQAGASALGPPAAAFGHTGSGGSSHGAWPVERVGFSFVTNELRPEARDDRARRLLDALHGSVLGS